MQRYQTEERYLSWMLTKFHQKWANSFCCLAFVAIGIPVAVRMRRGDFMTSFMLCFVPIVSAYQPLQFVGSSLAQSGQVPALRGLVRQLDFVRRGRVAAAQDESALSGTRIDCQANGRCQPAG